MNEEKKEPLQNEEVIEKPLDITPENIQKVKDQIAKEIQEENNLTDEETEAFKKLCEEAEMPVEFLDKDFKLGPQELDIRSLSKRNWNQMLFRLQVQQLIWIKNLHNTLLDVIRLLFVKLDHDGIQDIVKATDDVEAKIAEQTEILKQLKAQKENKSN